MYDRRCSADDNLRRMPPARPGEILGLSRAKERHVVTQVARVNGYRIAFQAAALLNMVAVLVQAVTAGQMMGGAAGGLHGAGAGAVHLLGLALVVTAVLLWRPGRGAGWPALVSVAVLLLGFVQSMLGGSGAVAAHVPLGVALFGLSIWLVAGSWRR